MQKENHPLYEEYLISCHPRLSDEPDHGLALKPEVDQDFRARAESVGLNYDQMKRNFVLSHQVISPREHKEGMKLLEKSVVPLSHLEGYFAGMVSSAISRAKARQKEPS